MNSFDYIYSRIMSLKLFFYYLCYPKNKDDRYV